jgi:hypothetical protein
MRPILLSLFLLFIQYSFAQNTSYEITDSEQEEGNVNQGIKYQDKIIYVGSSFESRKIPTMICVDTNGNVVWNTAISDATNYSVSTTSNQQFKLILGSDGFIYSTGMKDGVLENWKVNPATGSVIWKQVLTGVTYQAEYIKDYNSTHFLLAYNTSYNGLNYVKVISSINKSTGLITTSKTLGNYPWQKAKFCIEIDNSNNIYYSIQDSIKKLDANNWNNVLWQVKCNTAAFSTIPDLYFNGIDGKIVAIAVKSSNDQNHILSLDGANGTLLSTLPINSYDEDASQVTMRNNSLFVSFQHIYVGGNLSFYTILKYDLISYTLTWLVSQNFNVSQQAIRSFDFDDNDNIFCTGYYGSSGYGPGKWGILKLSPAGVPIYSQYIFRDSLSAASTNYSDGKISLVIGNKPCFVGIIDGQYSPSMSNACFVRLNNTTGNVELKKYLGGNTVKFESRCVQLISYQNDKKLALIKRGRIGQLYCLDALNNVLWVTTLEISSGDLSPTKMISTADGTIWVSALRYSYSYSTPYISSVASDIYMYKISSTGQIINTTSNNTTNIPLEFLVQNNSVYHIYKSSTTARIQKISSSPYTETNLNLAILNYSNNNYVTNASPTLSFITGNNVGLGTQYIYQLSDVMGGIISTKTYNMSGITFSCSAALNSTNLLIGAKNSAGKAIVYRFNSTINDTLWRYIETATGSENQIKLVVAENASSFYLLSNSSQDIIVRKINATNGSLIWKSTYNGALSNTDFGQDMTFDSNRNQLIVTGYETYGSTANRVPLILKLDTLGTFIDTVKVMNASNYLNGCFNEVLCLSDGSVVIGGAYNSAVNGNSALLTIANNPIVNIFETVNQCSTYFWPVNNQNYSSSGSYTYNSINNPDTIFHLNLSVNSTSVVESQSSCNSYTWPLNGLTYTSSGQYIDTIPNTVGCDSIITLNLTILQPTNAIDIQNTCDSITWLDGITYYANNSTATHVIPNAAGCDSIITLNLTILQPTYGIDTRTTCDSLTWIDGITYYANNTTATHSIPNAAGCDSIITLNLTLLQPTYGIDVQTVCDSLAWIDGITYYSNNNSATYSIANTAGCDSIVTLNLTIIPAQSLTLENSFSLPSDANNCIGQAAITVSGNADFELNVDNGSQIVPTTGYSVLDNLCPGVHDLKITDNCGDTLHATLLIPVDSNYVYNNPYLDSLAADSLGVTLTNCTIYYNSIDTAYIDSIWSIGNVVNVVWNIVDASGSNYDTTTYNLNNGNGVYLLQLSVFCPTKALGEYFTVTEAIYFENGNVYVTGIDEKELNYIAIQPNPTTDYVSITSANDDIKRIIIYDLYGKEVQNEVQNGSTYLISLNDKPTGIYLFRIITTKGQVTKRVVKQ